MFRSKLSFASVLLFGLIFAPAVSSSYMITNFVVGPQSGPHIVPDGQQGNYVVWVDNSGASSAVYLQHMSRRGVPYPGWPINGIRVCNTAGDQSDPAIASNPDGSVIVAWADHRGANWDIYAQRFALAGSQPQWNPTGVPVCNSAADQLNPTITADLAGGVYLAWDDSRNGSIDIYAQWITSAGVPGTYGATTWPANGAPVSLDNDDQNNAQITFWANALGPVVVWEDREGGPHPDRGPRVYVNFLDKAGNRSLGDGLEVSPVHELTSWVEQLYPLALPIGTPNEVIVVFRSLSFPVVGWDIRAQRISASGTRTWGLGGLPLVDAPYNQINDWLDGPYAVSDPASGTFAVTWEDHRPPWGANGTIWAQMFDFNGGAQWSEADTHIDVSTPAQEGVAAIYRRTPKIAVDGSGGVFIGWLAYYDPWPRWNTKVFRKAGNGSLICGQFAEFNYAAPISQLSLCAAGPGGVYVANVHDFTANGAGLDILGSWVNGNCTDPSVPSPPAIGDAMATACSMNSVTLQWTAPADGLGYPLASYEIRYSLNPITAANWGSATVAEAAMAAGSPGSTEVISIALGSCSYYYFGIKCRDIDGVLGGVSNEIAGSTKCFPNDPCGILAGVPSPGAGDNAKPTVLAMSRVGPLPASTVLSIEYDVPRELAGERVQLEAFDISGRVVSTVHQGNAAAGRHVVEWDLQDVRGGRVISGVYWLRLAVGRERLVRTVVVR